MLWNSFDIAPFRLACHNFSNSKQPFAEMIRVLKPNGKLVLIDLEAAKETFRNMQDEIERLRDPSYVRDICRAEILTLYQTHDLSVKCCEVVKMPMVLDHTQTPQEVQMDIVQQMERAIAAEKKTGFAAYYKDGKI